MCCYCIEAQVRKAFKLKSVTVVTYVYTQITIFHYITVTINSNCAVQTTTTGQRVVLNISSVVLLCHGLIFSWMTSDPGGRWKHFKASQPWRDHRSLTLYPTGRSWQSCVHPLSLRFKHSFTLQFLSSDWSPQSSLPSQRFPSEMQRPLEHMKKEPLHKLPKKSKAYGCHWNDALKLLIKAGKHFWPATGFRQRNLFEESSCGGCAFCFYHMSPTTLLGKWCC